MLSFCRTYFRRFRVTFAGYLLLNLVLSVIRILLPLISGMFINLLVGAGDVPLLLCYTGVFLILSILSLTGGYASNRLYIVLQTQTAYQMTQDLLARLRRLPLSYYYKKDAAHLTQQVGNDANTLTIYYLSLFTTAITDVFTLAALLILVFWLHAPIGAVLLLAMLLDLLAYLLASRRLYNTTFELSEAQNRYFSAMNEQLFRVKFIRLHALEGLYSKTLEDRFSNVLSSAKRNQSASYLVSGIDTLLQLLAQGFLFLYGGLAVWNGRMSLGLLTAFLSYYRSALSRVASLLGFGKARQTALVSFDRTRAILREPVQKNGGTRPGGIARIDIKGLTFSYGGKPVLNHRDFHFERGALYGIYGENGSGKTTLVELIAGLYQGEYEGSILFDGVNTEKLDMNEVRAHLIGVTEQEPVLNRDTLRRILTPPGGKEASEEAVYPLAQRLGLAPYLRSLPAGLDTVINEHSSNLSGGEKQKLSLLRQLLRDPDVLILDEPSSALDEAATEELGRLLTERKRGKIILIISHEPAFRPLCDELISMDT